MNAISFLSQSVSALHGVPASRQRSTRWIHANSEGWGGETVFCVFFFLFFSIILKMKKPRRRASCPGTAGTPHRNTLINTGSLEELKPPATSCSQTGESAEHLLHILLSVMRNRHTHTHTHTHISSLNFEHFLRISLWSFDSISVLRETDEIRALTSTHERSSHKNTHTHSRTLEDKEPIWGNDIIISRGVTGGQGWLETRPIPAEITPENGYYTSYEGLLRWGWLRIHPSAGSSHPSSPHLSWIDSTAHYW